MARRSRLLVGVLFSGALFFGFDFQLASPLAQVSAPPDGAALYQEKCALCHDNARDLTPPRSVISTRTPEEIILSLTTGSMRLQAAGLSVDAIRSIAVFLTGKQPGVANQPASQVKFCRDSFGALDLKGEKWNGWGFDLENTRYQPKPGLKADDVPKLQVKWAFMYPSGRSNSQPTIIGDRLFVSSSPGQVFALNSKTGCAYWSYNTGSGSRTAILIGTSSTSPGIGFTAYLGDSKSFVHAIDAATGKLLWKTQIETHTVSRITAAPVLYGGRLFVAVSSVEEVAGRENKYECCTFRGSLVALNPQTGEILWNTHSLPEPLKLLKMSAAGTQQYGPAGGAIWAMPTIDAKRNLVYVATGDSYTEAETKGADAVIALELETGRIRWINQVTPNDNFLVGCSGTARPANCPNPLGPDFDFGSSPILRTLPNGSQVILAGQKSGILYALDPANDGKTLWQVKVGFGSTLGGIQWGSAADLQNVYAAISDVTAPVDKRLPGLTALKIASGERLWHTPAPKSGCKQEGRSCSNAQSAAMTAIPGVVFSGSMDGHLRAYSTKDGSIIWDVNTAVTVYETVNGLKVKGGMINGGGPTVVNGSLYVNIGYGGTAGQAGNVLLAFTVDGK